MKRVLWWVGALSVGAILGLLNLSWIDGLMNFLASAYTSLFQLLAVPTIVLAVLTTFANFGANNSGNIFVRTLVYTLLTTVAAATVGAVLYVLVAPGNLPADALAATDGPPDLTPRLSVYDHLLSVIPSNPVRPLLEGNVLSLLLMAFAAGIGLSHLPATEGKATLVKALTGLQDLLFLLIRWLIWTLPLGIMAFAAQLMAQVSAGAVAGSVGKYLTVILAGNLLQAFVVLPLFLLARGLNPIRVFRAMLPALLMALFTKSSAATLPVTMEMAERRLGISPRISRFVLPLCTTVNMNGCAAFILVTSLFVMQHGGIPLTPATIITWILIAVVSAIGNAGVPMGCYFLTLSLMSGIGAPVGILGVILPIYTIIDMIETAENVWSDACVCAMTGNDLGRQTLKTT